MTDSESVSVPVAPPDAEFELELPADRWPALELVRDTSAAADGYSRRRFVAARDIDEDELVLREAPLFSYSLPLLEHERRVPWRGAFVVTDETTAALELETRIADRAYDMLLALEHAVATRPELFRDTAWMDEFETELGATHAGTENDLAVSRAGIAKVFASKHARRNKLNNKRARAAGERFSILWANNVYTSASLLSHYADGAAVYRWASAFNHACRANAWYQVVDGQRIEVRTNQPIRRGDEVSINYFARSIYTAPNDLPTRVAGFACRCAFCRQLAADKTRAVPFDERLMLAKALPDDWHRYVLAKATSVDYGTAVETFAALSAMLCDPGVSRALVGRPLALYDTYTTLIKAIAYFMHAGGLASIDAAGKTMHRLAVIARLALHQAGELAEAPERHVRTPLLLLRAQAAVLNYAVHFHLARGEELKATLRGEEFDESLLAKTNAKTAELRAEFIGAVRAARAVDGDQAADLLLYQQLSQLLVVRTEGDPLD